MVVVLAATAFYFYTQRNSVLTAQDFIIETASSIDKIIIEKGKLSLKLEKKDQDWIVNDTFQVNYALVKRFLRIFSNLDLVAPVSDNAKDTVLSNLEKAGTGISIFANDSKSKEYLLGHLNASGSGNIMYADNEKLAIVNATGLVKDLNSVISINSLYWRNKMVFNKRASEVVRVVHENILHPERSYTIYIENGKFHVLNHDNTPVKEINETSVERYFSYFQNIGFEQIENSLSKAQLDTVLQKNLVHGILLVDDSNISYKLNLYLKPALITKNRMSTDYDLNRIYGKMNNEDNILIFEYYNIDPILKDLEYFVQKNNVKFTR